MKKLFYVLCLTMLSFIPGIAQGQAALSFGDFDIKAGDTKDLVINLDNPDFEVWQMQFTLTLPKGLTFAKDERGRDKVSKTNRCPDHSLAYNEQEEEGVYIFLLYTADQWPLDGTSGAIINMGIVAADDFKAGTISVTDIKVTNTDSEALVLDDISLTFKEKIAVQVTVNDVTRKYGEANPALTYTVTPSDVDLTGKVTLSCDADAKSGVGEYTITATAADVEDMIVTCVNGKLTVTPAQLTATAVDATRRYGQNNPAFSIKYTGFVNGDTEAALAEKPVAKTEATAASAVGTYPIMVSGGKAANYEIVEYTDGTLTITKAQLTLKAVDVKRPYGQENPALAVNYVGLANGDTENVLTEKPTVTTEATAASNAGTYPITLTGGAVADEGNYEIVDRMNGTLTVNKVVLTATVDDAERMYGEKNPDFTVSCTGFVNGETEDVLTSAPYAVTEATASSSVGNYSINVVGGEATNYVINAVNGTLTVTPAPLKVTLLDAERSYGASDPDYEFEYEGFVNGDSETAVSTQPAVQTEADKLSPVGEYDITPVDGAAANYYFAEYVGAKLTVTKALLTVTANDAFRYVGEENPELTLTYDGFVNDEDETVLAVLPVATTTATAESPEGTYDIIVSGGEAKNYDFEYKAGTLTVVENTSSVGGLVTNGQPFDVYDLKGRKVRSAVTTLNGLPKGVYVVNGRKVIK